MSFLNPVAFALAALAAPIVALYFLKLRRTERTVSSTYLWRHLVRDTAANAPWQRLRPNLLLFLQLLFLALLVLALARPFTWSDAASGDHLILVLDTSASMQATDVVPNRLAEAVREARAMVAALPADARVTLIAAGAGTDVLVSGTTDRALVQRGLDGVRAGSGGSDLSAALTLAGAVAGRERDPETVIFSDGNVTLPAQAAGGRLLTLPGRVRYVPIGSGPVDGGARSANQGIMALSLRRSAGGQTTSVFVQVTNFGPTPVERRLLLYNGGQLVAARTLSLPVNQPQALAFEDLPAGLVSVEARLEGTDALALDDRAWATLPDSGAVRVDLVGPGNRFLETALGLLPGLDVTTIKPDDYLAAQDAQPADAATPAGLTIFDGVSLPERLPAGALLVLAPVSSTGLYSVTGQVDQPAAAVERADEPLLRYVDLRGLQIKEAARIPLPGWARPIIVVGASDGDCSAEGAPAACPLLFAGETGGRRVAVLAFDVRQSDLPLRVAFPILLANLFDYLGAGSGAGNLPEGVSPGGAVPLTIPVGATAVDVRLPDGTAQRVDASGGRAVFGDTTRPGIYEIARADTAGDGRVLGRFAVNLFDPQESALTLQNSLPVEGAADRDVANASRQSRREWWRPLAWLTLLALVVEWLYAHRGQVARLYQVVAARGRPA